MKTGNNEIPSLRELILTKQNPYHRYGMRDINDLLAERPWTTIGVTNEFIHEKLRKAWQWLEKALLEIMKEIQPSMGLVNEKDILFPSSISKGLAHSWFIAKDPTVRKFQIAKENENRSRRN